MVSRFRGIFVFTLTLIVSSVIVSEACVFITITDRTLCLKRLALNGRAVDGGCSPLVTSILAMLKGA